MTSQAPPYGPSVHVSPTHVFFYGYELQLPESRFQMWYPASFADPQYPDVRFQTAEHYVMHAKALIMSDASTAERILEAATPLEANRLGREIKKFDSELWKSKVEEIAERANYLKFSQVKEYRDALIATDRKVLAEASPVDRNWGIGFSGDEAGSKEEEWGRNLLGKALMRVRDRLKDKGV